MQILPPALLELIEALGTLPGVGPRTAERYAYFILKTDAGVGKRLAEATVQLHDRVGYCKITFALVEKGKELKSSSRDDFSSSESA